MFMGTVAINLRRPVHRADTESGLLLGLWAVAATGSYKSRAKSRCSLENDRFGGHRNVGIVQPGYAD